jgi:DNA-binding Lrp family transcriptional regulator
MDAIDRQILTVLQEDCRTTVLEIAKRVSLSSPSVCERLKKLHKKGFIKRYVAILDEKKLGKDITAFIHVSIKYPKYIPDFVRKVEGIPEILECHRITGNHTCLLKARVEDTQALDRLLTEGIGAIEGVTNATTEMVLSTLKEETKLNLACGE